MEIWDGYFADGSPANMDLIREEPIPKGIYHIVSEILVRHTDGDYLLMRRDPRKQAFGGWYEATAGGSALKGEDKVACARRELFEETGLCAASLVEIGHNRSEDTLYFEFLCVTEQDKDSIRLQEGETVSYRWVSEKDFIAFVNSDSMIPSQRERYFQYFLEKGYI